MRDPTCPLVIEPGVGFGYIGIGENREELQQIGIPVKELHGDNDAAILEIGVLKARLCGGKVIDIWLDDLRDGPDCVVFQGVPVSHAVSVDEFAARIATFAPGSPRHGGSFEKCGEGGVYLGYGIGGFLQIRVHARGEAFNLDEDCRVAMDNGSLITVSPEARAHLFEMTLDTDSMSKHWHPDKPGRDPLRIVKNEWFSAMPRLNMFGSTVVWIDRDNAKPETAYFEITKLEATSTRVDIEFRYPIEGVLGHAAFRSTGENFSVLSTEVRGR